MRLTPNRTLLTSAQFKGQNSECSLFCSACFLFIYLELFWRDRYWQTSQGTTCEAERDRSEEGISQPTKKKKVLLFSFLACSGFVVWLACVNTARKEKNKRTDAQATHTRRHVRRVQEKECREGKERWVVRNRCEIWHLKIYNVGVEWLQSLYITKQLFLLSFLLESYTFTAAIFVHMSHSYRRRQKETQSRPGCGGSGPQGINMLRINLLVGPCNTSVWSDTSEPSQFLFNS